MDTMFDKARLKLQRSENVWFLYYKNANGVFRYVVQKASPRCPLLHSSLGWILFQLRSAVRRFLWS